MYVYETSRGVGPEIPRGHPGLTGWYGESGTLRHFTASQLVLAADEARQVLEFFWPEMAIQIRSSEIGDPQREFAQALLTEAVDASYPMGVVEDVYKRFFLRVPKGFTSIAKSAIKVAREAVLRQWLRRTQSITAERVRIYENIRVTLARNFRSVLEIWLQTGDLTY